MRRTRLPSLYSDLGVQKTTNPEGYAANVTAWESALTRAALAGQLPLEQRLILQTSDELLNALANPQYGRPSGLGCVLDDCVRQGKMIDMTDFLTSERGIYNRRWVPSPWAVLRWSLRQVGVVGSGSYDVGGRLKTGSLVLVPALEEVWKLVLKMREQRAQGLTDRVMSREAFLKELDALLPQGHPTLSDQDASVLLRYLSRDKQALSYDETTIKFKAPAASLPEPLTHEDHTIASLQTLIANLTAQISNLTVRIATLQNKAQTSVKAGNKASALSALRSKKLADRGLQTRTDTLHQLEEVYVKIEAAADQVEVVTAMAASAGVLKTLNNRVGGVARVEDVLESLRDEMGKVDEVSGVMAEPLDGRAVLDEGEVDDELEVLEREERARKEEKLQETSMKEAREAELTRTRLAELDKPDDKVRLDLEQDLSKSIEKMQTLNIDGSRERQQIAQHSSS